MPPSSTPPVLPGTAAFVMHPATGPAPQAAPAASQSIEMPAPQLPATFNRSPAWLATGQPPAAPVSTLSRTRLMAAPVMPRTHAGLQRAAQQVIHAVPEPLELPWEALSPAEQEVIHAVLEPLGLQWEKLSPAEQHAVRADASHVPAGLTAEQTEAARLRAVFLRLEVPRHMQWLADLPLRDKVLDPARFAPAALQARLGGGDLSTETPEANAAYAVNALLGDARVQPAAFTAPPPGQALEPEAVAAVLHAQGIDTHLFRHTVLGHPAGPAPLDPEQVALLDRLQTNRLLLQVRVGAACHHVVFLRVAEQWLRLEHGQLPQQDGLSPSAFLRELEEAAGVHSFTALWPKHGPKADAPQPAAASAGQSAPHYDQNMLKNRARQKRRKQELQHFGLAGSWHELLAISNACGPTGKSAVDDQGQPVAGVYVNDDVQYADKNLNVTLPKVYRRIEGNMLLDVRLLAPSGDTEADSNNRTQILKEMQSTRKQGKSRRATVAHDRTEILPRHRFSTSSRANFVENHRKEFKAAGYKAQAFETDIVVGQCESGEVLQVWKDGMLAVASATPKGRATVLWQLKNGGTTSVRFVPAGQSPEEKRQYLLKRVHGPYIALGIKAHAWQRQGLIEALDHDQARRIMDRRHDALASMLGCMPEEVTRSTVRKVWNYCQAAAPGQDVPSDHPYIGMLTHFTIPPDISGLERESHVLCRRNENGKVADLLPFEADAADALAEAQAEAQAEIENAARRPRKRMREAEETDDEDYEDYGEDDAETVIPPSMQISWQALDRTDPPQEERGSQPADWNT